LRARGELLLFVDADVIYAPGTLRAAVAHAQASDAAVITLLPHFEMHGLGENAAMPMLAIFIYTMIPTWFANRTRVGALAVGGGPGNLVARDAYDARSGERVWRFYTIPLPGEPGGESWPNVEVAARGGGAPGRQSRKAYHS